MAEHGTCGFFVFDYNLMDTSYGAQAFTAIYEALKESSGFVEFNHGDIKPRTVYELARRAACLRPSESKSPLANVSTERSFGPYLASMWTDTSVHFDRIHTYLLNAGTPGYVGYMVLAHSSEYADFLSFVRHSLYLCACIGLRDGSVVKGTAAFGIGVHLADVELLNATVRGDATKVKEALNAGADPNCIDPSDRSSTPLLYAAADGHEEVVRILLAAGANPDLDNGTNSPLMLAARFGHMQVVQALLSGGADPLLRGPSGDTALIWAEDQKHTEIVRFLKEVIASRGNQSRGTPKREQVSQSQDPPERVPPLRRFSDSLESECISHERGRDRKEYGTVLTPEIPENSQMPVGGQSNKTPVFGLSPESSAIDDARISL